MIASLPMYDRTETRTANDRLWQGVRAKLGQGPDHLTRSGDVWDHWQSPDLILSQTCGYPYRARLHGRVTLVGTPVPDLPDCPPGYYYSVFVARADDAREMPGDFATARFAYNEALSQSGWAAPQTYAAAHGFAFSNPVQSGAHRASARAVAENRADIAALDALSWRMMTRYDPFAASLRVLARTAATPALPYITAPGRDPVAIFDALSSAISGLSDDDRKTLGISGLIWIGPEAYLAQPDPPPPPN